MPQGPDTLVVPRSPAPAATDDADGREVASAPEVALPAERTAGPADPVSGGEDGRGAGPEVDGPTARGGLDPAASQASPSAAGAGGEARAPEPPAPFLDTPPPSEVQARIAERLDRAAEQQRRSTLRSLDVEPEPYGPADSAEGAPLEAVDGRAEPSALRPAIDRREVRPKGLRDGSVDAHWRVPDAEAEASARDEIQQRYAGLGDREDRGSRSTGGAGRAPRDPARLRAPHRPGVAHKRIQPYADEDTLLAELAARYSRAYTGRTGWSPGALWDSVRYAGRLAGRLAGRPFALRRLRQARAAREKRRQDQLSELGEIALSLRDLSGRPVEKYRERLLDLHREQELREDEIDALEQRIEEARRDFARAARQHQMEAEALDAAIQETEEQLRPAEAAHRAALKKVRAAEEDARALEQQMDRARADLHRLRGAEGAGDEEARLTARLERWEAERAALIRELPRLEAQAAEIEPEIERLRRERDRRRQALREHREAGLQAEAEHKREVSRLQGEVERIRVALEQLAGERRALYLECGRQLDIDRPDHDQLEDLYRELDATAAEIRLLEQEIEVAQSAPDPPDWGALGRAAVVLGAALLLLVLIGVAVS